jgi:hypothetical protein
MAASDKRKQQKAWQPFWDISGCLGEIYGQDWRPDVQALAGP